jgi:5-methyltetrahydrofolate--homocysteine methyltransferase
LLSQGDSARAAYKKRLRRARLWRKLTLKANVWLAMRDNVQEMATMQITEQICQALMKGRAAEVKQLVEKALADGVPAVAILNDGLLQGMGIIGDKFKKNEVYVPEVLIAARAMKAGMEVIRPKLVAAGVKPAGTAVIGTVKGDLHDIGKNLVGMMLEGAGLHVVDAGIDVAPEKFVQLAKDNQAAVSGVSALLTTTMTNMKLVVDAVKESGLKTRGMVGGAPVTQDFCNEIGADGYAPDAASAADLAKKLLA